MKFVAASSSLCIFCIVCCFCMWTVYTHKDGLNLQQLSDELDTDGSDADAVYSITIIRQNNSLAHRWDEVVVQVNNSTAHTALLKGNVPKRGVAPSSYFVPQPVYVSMTTISKRIKQVSRTISGLIQGKLVPTHIYLCISEEPFLLDKGITSIPDNLLSLVAAKYLTIVYTQNIGPHRKLLPVLKRYWGQDVFIATVDDDCSDSKSYSILYQLLKQHQMRKRDHVIALRARRIGICERPNYTVKPYRYWSITLNINRWEMLLLPTGTGGILYKPSYFHEIVFDRKLWELTQTADDITFRLATLINEVPIQLGCSTITFRSRVQRHCKPDDIDRKFNATFTLPADMPSSPLDHRRRRILKDGSSSKGKASKSLEDNSSNELFQINSRGGNDMCWSRATHYLGKLKLLNFTALSRKYLREREDRCFDHSRSSRASFLCSTYKCD